MPVWLNFIIDSLAFGAVFIYASTGEILTEKAGHLNLGIPGIMCIGVAGGCVFLNAVGKSGMPGFLMIILGVLCSFLAAALVGAVYCLLTVTLHANQNVTGLALTTLGVGLMKYIMAGLDSAVYLSEKVKTAFRFPFAERSDALQFIGVMFFLAVIIAILSSFFLNKTKSGLNLRAVGESPATADAVGIDVVKYKYLATCIGSGIAGLGGFYYVVDYMGSTEAYKSVEAFGWLAIALVIFALWKPYMTILGSTLFGALFSCSSYIANFASKVDWLTITMASKPIMKMLPYFVTILVLVITSVRNKKENQPPSSLGLSYFREDR